MGSVEDSRNPPAANTPRSKTPAKSLTGLLNAQSQHVDEQIAAPPHPSFSATTAGLAKSWKRAAAAAGWLAGLTADRYIKRRRRRRRPSDGWCMVAGCSMWSAHGVSHCELTQNAAAQIACRRRTFRSPIAPLRRGLFTGWNSVSKSATVLRSTAEHSRAGRSVRVDAAERNPEPEWSPPAPVDRVLSVTKTWTP